MNSKHEMPIDIGVEKNKRKGEKSSIEFKSPSEHYNAEAGIVWCYDARCAELCNKFLSTRGFDESKVDMIKGAGGAQALAGEEGAERTVALSQIAKSIKLHHTERFILMVHMDCGGYGGSKAFDNDYEKEWDHHVSELEKAANAIRAEFPEIKEVECWVADFEGIYEIDAMVGAEEEEAA